MGGSSYSSESRSLRSASMGYFTKSADEIFTQNIERKIHESMSPKGVKLREARDSETHPNSVPIILALDVTGSMGGIPHHLVKNGLPHIMSGIIQKGIADPALLFLAIGDTECDRYPLQVGQFESGDVELDTWLTRTYIEGGGGGNAGESYLLAWYFAARHTVTDSWDKRKQKGFLFTTGDEPSLTKLPKNVITELMGEGAQAGFTDKELLEEAQKTYHVYHLHILQGAAGKRSLGYWKELLGDNCIAIANHEDVSKVIVDIVTRSIDWKPADENSYDGKANKPTSHSKEEEIL
jgi:hypothetical protein